MKINRTSFAAVSVTAATTLSSTASVTLNNFPDVTIQADLNQESLFYDFETATVSTTFTTGSDFRFSVTPSLFGGDDLVAVESLSGRYKILGVSDGIDGELTIADTSYALRFQAGDSIGGEGMESGLGAFTPLEDGSLDGLEITPFVPGVNEAIISGGGETVFDPSGTPQFLPSPLNNFSEGDSGFLTFLRYDIFSDGGEFGFPEIQTRAGFVEIEIGSLTVKSASLVNDPVDGQSIQVIPEASSISLLALGLGGLAGYRRRRAANA